MDNVYNSDSSVNGSGGSNEIGGLQDTCSRSTTFSLGFLAIITVDFLSL
jgi:hypothetical protein